MKRSEILEKLKELLKEYTSAPVDERSLLYDELGFDSFYILHFISDVEDAYHIFIEPDACAELVNIGGVIDQIMMKLGKR